MRKAIYKYRLNMNGSTSIEMPINAVILSTKIQHNELFVWVEVNVQNGDELIKEARHFKVLRTGDIFEVGTLIGYKFISTVMLWGGDLVLHVYVMRE